MWARASIRQDNPGSHQLPQVDIAHSAQPRMYSVVTRSFSEGGEGGIWEGDQSIGGWDLGRRPGYWRVGSGKETSLLEGGVREGDQSIGGWGPGRRPVYERVGSGKETISVAIDKIKLHYRSKY